MDTLYWGCICAGGVSEWVQCTVYYILYIQSFLIFLTKAVSDWFVEGVKYVIFKAFEELL